MLIYTIYKFVHYFFLAYTLLLTLRILGSWVPSLQRSTLMRFVSFYTDPYLRVFQRIIPPIGGTLDISPILAFFSLRFLESFVFWILQWIF